MLIPILSYEILVGLVLKRGAVVTADEDELVNYIERLVADNAAG
jgi:hypothetical protein